MLASHGIYFEVCCISGKFFHVLLSVPSFFPTETSVMLLCHDQDGLCKLIWQKLQVLYMRFKLVSRGFNLRTFAYGSEVERKQADKKSHKEGLVWEDWRTDVWNIAVT